MPSSRSYSGGKNEGDSIVAGTKAAMENPRGLPSYTIVWFWLALAADQFLLQLLFFAHQLTVLISKKGAPHDSRTINLG